MNFTDEGIGVGHEQPGTPTRQTWANLGVKTAKETCRRIRNEDTLRCNFKTKRPESLLLGSNYST